MKKSFLTGLMAAGLAFPAFAQTPPPVTVIPAVPPKAATGIPVTAAPTAPPAQSVTLTSNSNREIGTAAFTETPKGFYIQLAVQNLMPGWHAVHVHATGDCSNPSVFQAAGSHLAHAGEHHGEMNPGGPHEGDLPNIWVNTAGEGRAQFFTSTLTHADVYDGDGSAIVIHSGPDDYMSDPAGQSGTRVACGVIAGQNPVAAITPPVVATPPAAAPAPATPAPAPASAPAPAPAPEKPAGAASGF